MRSKRPAIPYIGWMLVFTIVPLIMVVYFAFTDAEGRFSLESFQNASMYSEVFLYSLWIALISTLICLVLAYPLAYSISRASERAQSMIIMFLMVPMWMNFLLRIYAWVLILQNYGPLDMILNLFGIDVTLIGNSGAVIVGMVYEFLPFMVLPLHTVMSKIDPSLYEAAQDLGCNGFHVFRKVIFPLSVPGIISGVTMVFVPTASTFLVAQYLGGTQFMIGDVIERVFQSDHHTGSAIAVVLMVVILGFLVFMNRFGDKEAVN
ncbi:MAG: ABC transporter permease [Ruminococcus sp.]|nr:ABC transporter permease [Ruminococcus sp.]